MRARTPVRRSFSVFAGVALAAAAVSAQDPAKGERSSRGFNRVIVRAWTNGQPITDLKPGDLTIRVDGRQREVKSLNLVTAAAAGDAPAAAPAPAAAAPAAPLPAPFVTNTAAAAAGPAAPAGSREFLIVLDDEGIAAGQEESVRAAVARIMAEASPADRFGIVSLRLGGVAIAPTTDRQTITTALAKFVGGGSTSESPLDMTCRAQRAIGSLGGIFETSPAGRTLVLISPGIAANTANSGRMMSNNINSRDVAQTCVVRTNDMEELGNAASASPANMYVLYYAEGMANTSEASAAQAGLENIAGVTNAEFIRLSGGTDAALSRIPRETAAYYIATLEDAGGGQMRRIDARVNRDGAKVLARPAGDAPAGAAAPASAKNMSPRDMAMTPTSFSDVRLRAAGFLSRQGTSDMKVVTLFEPVDPGTKLTAAAVAVIDESGKATLLTLRPEDLDRKPMLAPQLIKPGKYRVRVAAKTADGAGGTLDFEVTGALDEAPPLKMGTMMLGVTGPTGFSPRLQFSGADAMAVGVMEIYGVAKGANVTAEFEIGESDGSVRGTAAGNIGPGPGEDARMVFGGFDIGTLEPGDYIMRAKVSVDGKLAGTATRTLRKAAAF